MFSTGGKLTVSIFVIALLLTCFVSLFKTDYFSNTIITEEAAQNVSKQSIVNDTAPLSIANPPALNKTSIPDQPNIKHSNPSYNSPATPQATIQPPPTLNETFLLSAIDALKTTGGHITLESDLTITNKDVLLPSNITLSGASSQTTIFLAGKRIEVAAGAVNVTVENLTIDASNIGERIGFVIRQNATNIQLANISFRNYNWRSGCLLNQGNQVNIENLTFNAAVNCSPIHIHGSNVSVTNCVSNGNSYFPLVTVGGGISDINLIGNVAVDRPLLSASYAATPTKNLWIENNTNYFPNATYAALIMGGVGDNVSVSHENVTFRGNYFKGAVGAFNAISIYGLTRNAVVERNTLDQSLTGHNAIGISSGINVTVSENEVYGCTEAFEGGIEVESNPVHNRRVGFSENVTVTRNTVYNSTWGIYVRVMCPEHPNWNGTILKSRNIIIEDNRVFGCKVGVNLLTGENITVRNNNIEANEVPFRVNTANVSNYTVVGNIGYP